MAARASKKVTSTIGASAGSNRLRTFTHADGRSYELQVLDCRVYESWVNAGQGGGANVSTRADDEDAAAFARKKAASLVKKGFVEGPDRAGRVADRSANVVEVLRSDLDYAGRPRSDFQPLEGHEHTWAWSNVSVGEWLVTDGSGTRAILLRCGIHGSTLTPQARDALSQHVLAVLGEERDAIFADERTPVRAFALGPLGAPFSRLIVLSPTVENHVVQGRFTVSRSVFRAFPAFECEMRDVDSVAMAEARTAGHGTLRTTRWDRPPHPVLDLAYVEDARETPTFLVHPPDRLEALLVRGLATMKTAEVLARNHRGEVRRFVRGQTPPALDELRAFFGFAS